MLPVLLASLALAGFAEARSSQRGPAPVLTRADLQTRGYQLISRADMGYGAGAGSYFRRACELPIYYCDDRNTPAYNQCRPAVRQSVAAICSPFGPTGQPKPPGALRDDQAFCAALQACGRRG